MLLLGAWRASLRAVLLINNRAQERLLTVTGRPQQVENGAIRHCSRGGADIRDAGAETGVTVGDVEVVGIEIDGPNQGLLARSAFGVCIRNRLRDDGKRGG